MLSYLVPAGAIALATRLSLGVVPAIAQPAFPVAANVPGVSAALSAAPPYSCVTNHYVDGVNGNDTNPGTQAEPWKTISRADGGGVYPFYATVPGECVNVLPGTYSVTKTLTFSHGGNSNSLTGYVVYRSTVPQGAHIIAGSNLGDIIDLLAGYFIVDGFEIDGNHSLTGGNGINACNGGSPVVHHFMAINNLIHDMGSAGLTACKGDYLTWRNNVVYNTSSTSTWQVSGLDLWEPQALAAGSYTPTAWDSVPFNIVFAYNIVYDNAEGPSIPSPHTDGNGIIIDTTFGSSKCPTCGTPYPNNILVLGNVSYNNGGCGINVFLSENVTVANNTVYNNHTDALNPGTTRGELSNGGSQNVSWINNIAIAVPGTGVFAGNKPIYTFPVAGGFQDIATWTRNITFGASNVSDATSNVKPSTNLVSVNPKLTDLVNGNFVPLPGSPAIGAGMPETYLLPKTPDIGAY